MGCSHLGSSSSHVPSLNTTVEAEHRIMVTVVHTPILYTNSFSELTSYLITVEVNTDTVRVHSEWYKLRSDKLVQ